MQDKHTRLRKLCESAVFLALAVVLSYIKLFPLPFGGAVTLCSMLPVCLVSCKYGVRWGLGTAFCFSWFQVLQGGVFAWGLTPWMLTASIFLDYLAAFTVLGLSGLWRARGTAGCALGIAFACALRFLIHFLSGVVLWANFEEFIAFGTSWVGRPVLYSICYNGAFMLPETVLTVAAAIVLLRVPQTKKLLFKTGD